MLAWVLCGGCLAFWFYFQVAAQFRWRVLLVAGLSIVIGVIGVPIADSVGGGLLAIRMRAFTQIEFTYESISVQFLRLEIWMKTLSIVSDNLWLGVGQVNERLALKQEMEWERWIRAHQTYISYLLAGGIPALISGLVMQSPTLSLLTSAKRPLLFPVFLGLGVVVTLNCFTDSIFQSAVSVQVFMAATLIFLRASDADHPTLQPQNTVSSAAT